MRIKDGDYTMNKKQGVEMNDSSGPSTETAADIRHPDLISTVPLFFFLYNNNKRCFHDLPKSAQRDM